MAPILWAIGIAAAIAVLALVTLPNALNRTIESLIQRSRKRQL